LIALAEGPLALPADWERLLHRQVEPAAAEQIGKSLKRGRPLGDDDWTAKTAKELNLESTRRAKGRPKKVPDTSYEARLVNGWFGFSCRVMSFCTLPFSGSLWIDRLTLLFRLLRLSISVSQAYSTLRKAGLFFSTGV